MEQSRLLWAGKTEETVGSLPHLGRSTRQRPANFITQQAPASVCLSRAGGIGHSREELA